MAHARTTDSDARLIEQCSQGRRVRNIYSIPLIIAAARTNMTDPNHALADAIQNQTITKGVFVAPCAGKITRCYVNAGTYATCDTGGSATVKMTKAVIGTTDVDLCSTIGVGAVSGSVPTAETAIDGTLSTTSGALNLVEGQLVYATLAVSDHAITDRSENLIAAIEFVAKD